MGHQDQFAGKTVIVTGSAMGMGRATALAFATAGANVVIADIAEERGESLAREIDKQGGTASFEMVDVRHEEDLQGTVERTVARFGKLDVMVNNAAVLGEWRRIANQSARNLDRVLDVNIKGVVYGMKHALAAMLPRGEGVIVNVSSVQGFRVAYPGASFYAASKAAVVSLTKSAAMEYGGRGIRIVGIAPGPIDTPMLRGQVGDEWPPAIVNDTPLGRCGHPDEIARTILWLCSDEASFITGATLPVDGGYLAP